MDLLVKLYDMPQLERTCPSDVLIRPAMVPERHIVVDFVRKHFSEYWVSEVEFALSQHPVRCLVAIQNENVVGFACYDTTFKGFFGPTGVSEAMRGRGIGELLLHKALNCMKDQGHCYAFVGKAGPKEFYERSVNAIEIEGSVPGAYKGILRRENQN
ncbi:GNAT family N-acetyltransferase [Vibrio sp. Isolate25]|uniref:GNAT family N-acetyltransferase n=1 Tax=Vibrio sp. Isolate25 TaxID=2908535 RepID=UPI001EFCEA5C|nr:GNAT family N-acetyltransferase [Vibrio sp. Isolate25]MCG9595504.1 GNAT family N-acetyltransferase [Vibrio sp. Isolate25]